MIRKRFNESKNYNINLIWDHDTGAIASINSQHIIKLDTPAEYGGKGRFPCPHELLFTSLGGCLLTTFLRIAKDMSLNLKEFEVKVNGELDATGQKIRNVKVVLHPQVVEEDRWEAEECARLTEKYCPIRNSLKTSFTTKITIFFD